MPVLLVGAATDVGRRLARILLGDGAQVRVYVDRDEESFRSAGCNVAVGEFENVGRLESAMEQVHTVVHLAGGARPPEGRSLEWWNEETTSCSLIAAAGAGVTRFLSLSDVGAATEASNPFLRSRGRADEAVVSESRFQSAIVRCAPVLGSDSPLGVALRAAGQQRTPQVLAPGTQRFNPIWAADVAEVLARADARGEPVEGIWEFGGPDVVTYEELVQMATARSRNALRRHPASLPRVLADAWCSDRVANSAAALERFGVVSTPLSRALGALAKAWPETS